VTHLVTHVGHLASILVATASPLRQAAVMRAHLALPVCLLLVACGGDDDGGGAPDGGGSTADAASADAGGGDDAGPADGAPGDDAGEPGEGEATIRGTIDGQTLETQSAWYTSFPLGDAFVLAMPEDERVCDAINVGEGLTALIDFSCGAAREIDYPVIEDVTMPCDPEKPHTFVRVEGIDGPVPELVAENGTVTVDTVDDTSVVGTFTASFGSRGFLSGSFNASICPPPK
jgi:hypothetical protein